MALAKLRVAKQTPERRSEIAGLGGKAGWANLTEAEKAERQRRRLATRAANIAKAAAAADGQPPPAPPAPTPAEDAEAKFNRVFAGLSFSELRSRALTPERRAEISSWAATVWWAGASEAERAAKVAKLLEGRGIKPKPKRAAPKRRPRR